MDGQTSKLEQFTTEELLEELQRRVRDEVRAEMVPLNKVVVPLPKEDPND